MFGYIGARKPSESLFPLTPALSPREREPHSAARGDSNTLLWCDRWGNIPPEQKGIASPDISHPRGRSAVMLPAYTGRTI